MITFSPGLRERAIREELTLFRIEVTDRHLKKEAKVGTMEISGCADRDFASGLAILALHLAKGKTPDEAFAEAFTAKQAAASV